jgi:hypothetical protein
MERRTKMIPQNKIPKIAERLTEEFGPAEDIGRFVFQFAALPSGHDVEYALDELKRSNNPLYKKAINLVLEEISNG